MGRFHPHGENEHHHLHDAQADHHHDHKHDHGDHDHADVGDHSGYATGSERVMVLENILGENERIAQTNRADFDRHGIRTINVMSSPGAGKTTLLAETIPLLADRVRVGVLEGDIATSIDADRLEGLGAEIALVNTDNGFGGECHLDAVMVRSGLDRLPLHRIDLLLIENVGNLVCPAEFEVGEDARLMIFSITEGEEKPLKYPVMFRSADAIVVNKVDLLPHLDFDIDRFVANVESVNPGVPLLMTSARSGEGVDAVADWLTTPSP